MKILSSLRNRLFDSAKALAFSNVPTREEVWHDNVTTIFNVMRSRAWCLSVYAIQALDWGLCFVIIGQVKLCFHNDNTLFVQ